MSTQLPFGPESWEIALRGEAHSRQVALHEAALSPSEAAVQGSHIVSAAPGRPAGPPRVWVWVRTDSAALADALSTAALHAEDLQFSQDSGRAVDLFYEDAEGIQVVECRSTTR